MDIWDLPYDGKVKVHTPYEGRRLIRRAARHEKSYAKYNGREVRRYSSAVAAFDIETSKVENVKWDEGLPEMYHYFSFPFCWQFMINNTFVFGRDPKDFFDMLDKVRNEEIVIVYIHNINYEFGNLVDFFTRHGEVDCLMKNSSTPLYIRYKNFEFRCSAQLTHKALWQLGEDIDYVKLKGDFDYSIERDWDTPLTDLEKNYCYRDVAILVKWITREAENYCGKLKPSGLPYTQTGYVRDAIKKAFSHTKLGKDILTETALTYEEFLTFSRAFYGGYTHSNFRNVARLFTDVLHVDITSAYPWAMVTQLYPYKMRKCRNLTIYSLLKGLKNPKKAYICDLKFSNIRLKKGCIPYAPYSDGSPKHYGEKAIAENGRLLYADKYVGTFCDVDINLILEAYEFGEMEVLNAYVGLKRPLPNPVVSVLIHYFCNKTELKGVAGKEYEYNLAKQLLNGIYGLSAQSPEKTNFTINEDLTVTNKGTTYEPAKVLPYQWAIYITAYVRRVIYGNILKFPDWNLYLYCDTDSIFAVNDPRIRAQFEEYNRTIIAQLEELKEMYPAITPANPKGEVQYLGTLLEEKDDCYGFMTIGAKRYFIKHPDGTVDLTVSGLRATKTWYDKDENGKPIKDAAHHHNGFNTDRLIDMFGTIEEAFQAIRNGADCNLPYVEGVDKLSNYVTVFPYEGKLCGHTVTRPCSYTLYPVDVSLSLNAQLMNVLRMIERGSKKNIVYSEIY